MKTATHPNLQNWPLCHETVETAPLPSDHWIAASLLQKAIRRCDAPLAERAALALYRWRGRRVWRRLAIIAVEDVGIGSIDVVVEAVTLCAEAPLRTNSGDEVRQLLRVVRLLADATKDRAADYLIAGAHHHPSLAETRAKLAVVPVADRIAFAADLSNSLYERALATWFATGIGVSDTGSKGDLGSLLSMYAALGVPSRWLRVVRSTVKQTREPLALMLLPLWIEASGASAQTAKCPLPVSRDIQQLPLFALDKHTRPGKRAIREFARENVEVEQILSRHVRKGNANAGILSKPPSRAIAETLNKIEKHLAQAVRQLAAVAALIDTTSLNHSVRQKVFGKQPDRKREEDDSASST